MCTTVTTAISPYGGRNARKRPVNGAFSYPPIDRYGRKPERFLCRNCIVYIDNPVIAERHGMVTMHTVDEIFS